MTIKKYIVLSSHSTVFLAEEVNELIEKGWVPHGSMIYNGGIYYQPMVLLS